MYHGSINENDLKYLSREELDKRINLVRNNLHYVRTGVLLGQLAVVVVSS